MSSIRNIPLSTYSANANQPQESAQGMRRVDMQDKLGNSYTFYTRKDHFGGINPGRLYESDGRKVGLRAKANFFKSIKKINPQAQGKAWGDLELSGLYFSGKFTKTPRLGSRDRDHDGVRDDADVCPDVFGDFRGCPNWQGWREIKKETP